ncbi:MAG: myo-inositol-1-phosphate synthase [Candidatus Portnoybacteria bacterium RBG_19FT_COMBO_36_7]|uniref:Myo-inositol-1-phosphate synthase n=1 Tax=Candidatus Portnoybacteria bacterium RBG_19FT_COMBO_36_7 TaxID=1801992 RepID=A0A1G2F8R7_9BACT|nr:MAG: myo-inositol-1-phosphate synthase [Candidatus Portnoybacteria bacterium RBG_19FT_COMBO_36_7]
MSKPIRVGVIGVGNCFSGLAQGIEYYKSHKTKEMVGLMHERVGPYKYSDIEFVSAFDVGKNKIGEPLNEAVYKSPNLVKWTQLPQSKTIVKEAPVMDGIGIYVLNKIQPLKNPTKPAKLRQQILEELAKTKTEILINYLPVGSQKATELWANIAIETHCAFINCIPVFIASDKKWSNRFARAKLPVIGDDIKGQIGATIVHRVLAKLCDDRGTKIHKTYQLNVGGNTDFLNMKESSRLKSKKISKTTSVQSQLKEELKSDNIYVGPSDFIPFLGNTKLAFIRIEGKMFADVPYSLEMRLEVDDKANSAGVAIDAIRCAKLALDRHKGGYLDVSSYFMKHPLHQYSDAEAKLIIDNFIKLK